MGTGASVFEVQGLKCNVQQKPFHKGKYTTLWKVNVQSKPDEMFCLKRVLLPASHAQKANSLLKEIEILCRIPRNKYVVQHIAHHREKTKKGAWDCALLLEYIPGQDTFELMKSGDLRLKLRCIQHVAKALKHLHSNMYLHLNVRPSSIVYKERNGQYYFILADLGSAVEIGWEDNDPDRTYHRIKEFHSGYRAPEVFTRSCRLTPKTDVFSLGVVLYEFLFQQLPFAEIVLQEGDPIDLICAGYCDQQIWNFVENLLRFSPQDRYNLRDILQTLSTLYDNVTSHRAKAQAPDWLHLLNKSDQNMLQNAISQTLQRYGRVTEQLKMQIRQTFGLDKMQITQLTQYVSETRINGVEHERDSSRAVLKEIDSLLHKSIRNSNSPPKFKYLHGLVVILWDSQAIEFKKKKSLPTFSHRIYHVLKRSVEHTPLNVFKSLHILHFLMFHSTPEFVGHSFKQTKSNGGSGYYQVINRLFGGPDGIVDSQSLFTNLVVAHNTCLIKKASLHHACPILEGNFSWALWTQKQLDSKRDFEMGEFAHAIGTMIRSMMDLAQNFIEYGTLILEETNSVMRAESRETRALKENDFSLVRFELVSIYSSSCFAIGMLNIIEPSAIEPIADDFFTTMQHIYQFTQTIEKLFPNLYSGSSIEPIPLTIPGIAVFSDGHIFPPSSFSPSTLSHNNEALMTKLRNKMKAFKYKYNSLHIESNLFNKLRKVSDDQSAPSRLKLGPTPSEDENVRKISSPKRLIKNLQLKINTSANTIDKRETKKRNFSVPINLYQPHDSAASCPVEREKTPPPKKTFAAETPLVHFNTETPPLEMQQTNDPVPDNFQSMMKRHSLSDQPSDRTLLEDPFSFLDNLHNNFESKVEEDQDRGRRYTPSESYSHNPDFSSDYPFDHDGDNQFGPMNARSTNPFEPVEREDPGNTSPSRTSVSILEPPPSPDTNRLWVEFQEDVYERRQKNMLQIELSESIQEDDEPDELTWNDVEVYERIGVGGFAEVFKAKYGGDTVAVKRIINQRINEEVVSEFKHETSLMRRLDHANIVKFIGACTVPPNLVVVTELCEMSLFDLLHNTSVKISWKIRHRIALDATMGLQYLHAENPPIIHRDLKSANLLLDKRFHCKITDFGLSRVKDIQDTMTAQTGTFQWMAPEVIGGRRYNEQADIYSLAICFWELCKAQIPFDGMNGVQVSVAVMTKKQRPHLDHYFPPCFRTLIARMWDHDPRIRPTSTQVITWLQQKRDEILAFNRG